MKKIVSVLLAVFLLAGFCGTCFADDTVYTEGYFYYTVEDGSITIVGYFGNETEVTIPASIAGVPVNAVAPGAFVGTGVTKIELPDTIMSYGGGTDSSTTVTFDSNTDHAYEATEIEGPSSEEKAGTEDQVYVETQAGTDGQIFAEAQPGTEGQILDEAQVDLDVIEEHEALLESVAPSPVEQKTDDPAEPSATEPAAETAEGAPAGTAGEDGAPAADGEEETAPTAAAEQSRLPMILGGIFGVAIAIGAILFVRKKKQ